MTTGDGKRLIEVAFPLKQTSLDSVHEKNVRHGHISTLHIWPARRPLAAARAALIATLLPDPGDAEKRKAVATRAIGSRAISSHSPSFKPCASRKAGCNPIGGRKRGGDDRRNCTQGVRQSAC